MSLSPLRSSSNEFGSQRRIIVHPDVLKGLKVYAGDLLLVKSGSKTLAGLAWPSLEIDKNVVILPRSHYTTFGFENVARPSITLESGATSNDVLVKDATILRLKELGSVVSSGPPTSLKGKEKVGGRDWLRLLVRENLVDLRYLVPGQQLEVQYERKQRTFEVLDDKNAEQDSPDPVDSLQASVYNLKLGDASPSSSSHTSRPTGGPVIWKTSWNTQISLVPPPIPPPSKEPAAHSDPYSVIGGLSAEIAEIRDLIEIPLVRPELYKHYNLKPPKGLLLHGPPGTGKTHLALTIAASLRDSPQIQGSVTILHISGPELHSPYHGETEGKLRAVFEEARTKAPSVVVLDEVDAICPKREDRDGGGVEARVVATLLSEMDGLASREEGKEQRVVVVATTNRPNAIDPALRRPGRFDREIEIGVPTAPARAEILEVLLRGTPHNLSEVDIQAIASKTHGYVGADLSAVIREAGTRAIKRVIHAGQRPSEEVSRVSLEDVEAALPLIQPSALRSLALPVPSTPWSSLGGKSMKLVRQKLTECMSWPLLYPSSFERFGVQPPKGVLMYGPPGCSKTMVGRALASEAGINFLAVRGPELLNKFVGESERAVRELFSKARAAKPCIIFFDEIDALAMTRSSETSHSGMLTSLLNEMDGIQDSSGVVVVGATNRPQVIDSALMRPGRLDRLIYIAPPSLDDRIDILRIKTEKMAVDPELDIEEIAKLTEGCSGAELTAMCRDAALATMALDMNSPFVPNSAFVEAARKVRRQITKEMLEGYEKWKETSGIGDV